MDEPEAEIFDRTSDGDEQAIRDRTERLVTQLAELYNENTLLRQRVRILEREMRRASKRG
ncbi:MAG TPA: hypothetical protein VGT40_05875 [Methylomirabilota bacterium]|nr:hypothetical protein [Methylomirabilota bacterium]